MFTKNDRVEILHNSKPVAMGTIVKQHPVIDSWWIVKHDVSQRNIAVKEADLQKVERSDSETDIITDS